MSWLNGRRVIPRWPKCVSTGKKHARLLGIVVTVTLAMPGTVRADITDLVDRLGGMLGALRTGVPPAPGSIGSGSTHRMVMNGQSLTVLTGRTTGSIRQVLDHYQKVFPGGALKELAGHPVAMRREGTQTGQLLIVEVASEAAAKEITEGKRTMLSTGPLRMVYARRAGEYTDYLAASSAKPVPDDAVDPSPDRDAPGADLPGVPRPAGAVRSLSFIDKTTGYSLVQYRLHAAPQAALLQSSEKLRGAGFTEDPSFAGAARDNAEAMRLWSRSGATVMVRVRPLATDSQLIYVLDSH